MALDGNDHVDVGWIYPIRHASGAPLAGEAVGEVLRNLHSCVRHHNNLLFSHFLGRDLRRGTQWVISSMAPPATYTAIGSGWHVLIPDEATHLSVRVGATALGKGLVKIRGRLNVNGTTGSAAEVTVPDLAAGLGAQARGSAFELTAEIALAGGVAGTRKRIKLEAYAEDSGGGTFGFQVFYAVGFWEVRG